jgi:thiamine-phosphate pyrophosphorylase
MKASISGLYAITPECPDTAHLLDQVGRVLKGGAAAVQYRSKSDDVALRHEQASELLMLCRRFGVPLIINDDLRLADLADADGVHLGRDDASILEARMILGPDKIIGASCYNRLDLAVAAEQAGADYAAFGSMFPSPTKPGAVRAPLALFAEARTKIRLPLVAIGGITRDNARSVIEAGADAVAVITDLFETQDIEASAAAFSKLFH